ncbi:hypothetical protein Pcinc_027391 [Petrolisthes cinctipes]|uniref:Uncharacterized protein n=1 Tax=Petrolisthes cinctipes TaxID=88211 RepID=A0AAE1F461_PETCI|nr:hypothetical protein Pcinc_027391 [Petrolisthes cinctipes]
MVSLSITCVRLVPKPNPRQYVAIPYTHLTLAPPRLPREGDGTHWCHLKPDTTETSTAPTPQTPPPIHSPHPPDPPPLLDCYPHHRRALKSTSLSASNTHTSNHKHFK